MTVATHQIAGGARVLIFTCDEPGCGKPACYGEGVNLRAAIATGNVKLAGTWGCAQHHPRERKDDFGEVA